MNLSVVAMALSGYTDEKNTLWQQMCSLQSSQLKNPYLAAIFQFLTTDPDSYADMLVSVASIYQYFTFRLLKWFYET